MVLPNSDESMLKYEDDKKMLPNTWMIMNILNYTVLYSIATLVVFLSETKNETLSMQEDVLKSVS